MKKWLLAETAVLTALPVVMLLQALPMLLVSAILVFFPLDSETRAFHQRVYGMLPYLGGMLGLVMVWRYALALCEHKRFTLDWRFLMGAMGGALATWELFSTTNSASTAMICLPTWFLAGHVLYLRGTMAETPGNVLDA